MTLLRVLQMTKKFFMSLLTSATNKCVMVKLIRDSFTLTSFNPMALHPDILQLNALVFMPISLSVAWQVVTRAMTSMALLAVTARRKPWSNCAPLAGAPPPTTGQSLLPRHWLRSAECMIGCSCCITYIVAPTCYCQASQVPATLLLCIKASDLADGFPRPKSSILVRNAGGVAGQGPGRSCQSIGPDL